MAVKKIQKESPLLSQKETYYMLGYLFYAVAMVDKRMVVKEKRKIVELTNKHWSFVIGRIDSSEIIYAAMRELIQQNLKPNKALDVFKSFYKENKADFTDNIKHKIMDSVSIIIHAFAGQNKSELVLAFDLHNLFFGDNED